MKVRKILVICLSVLLFTAAGCNTPGEEKAASSDVSFSSTPQTSSSSSVSTTAPSDETSTSKDLESTSSKSETKKPQNESEWVAYDTNKDGYKLHIKKKDGTEDKVILDELVSTPCVAGEWVYYFANLDEIYKIKLDGSQKTKVCDTDAFQVYNVNVNAYHGLNGSTSITAEYLDGYISYTCFQLHEVGDKPNPPSYYKLDLNKNEIIPVNS